MIFNLNDLMNNVSKGTADVMAPAYEVVELDAADLIANEKNNIYNVEKIQELKNAIELAGGIKQNLIVEPLNAYGKYKIIAGHRRWAAVMQLVKEGKEQYRKVPCLIEMEADAVKRELLLIYTNATARELTDAEKARQSQRATELLTEIKNREGLSGRVRDLVADMLHTTAAQIGRYQSINKNLTNESLKEAFESGELKVSAAYEASKLDAEGQAEAAAKLEENKGLTISDVKEIAETPVPKMVEFTEDGQQIEYAEENIVTKLSWTPGGDVTESDTQKKERNPHSEYINISKELRDELQEEFDTIGIENMEPCRQCTWATGCQGCCNICNKHCTVRQTCRRKEDNGLPWENGSTRQEASALDGYFDKLPDEMEIDKEDKDWVERDAFRMVQDTLTAEINNLEVNLLKDGLTEREEKTYKMAKAIYDNLLSALLE